MSYSTLHQFIKKYYQSLTGTFNATKSTMTEDTGNRKWGMLTCCMEVFKTRSCCKSTTLQMIQMQILAGASDQPSISSEGFSPSIFTAFVCSYLLKSVPKPLKDTSL